MDVDVLQELLAPPGRKNPLYGVSVGVVTNNQDPEGLGRVKVRLPWLSDEDESHWARVLTPMAGNDRGLYFLPEVDDEVLVAFEHGQVEFPFILGALWNGKDKPPQSNDDGENNKRTIRSRSGHVITFDDTEGDEKIIIRDKTERNEIVIDSSHNAMTIKAGGDLTIDAGGRLTIRSQGDMVLDTNASGSIKSLSNLTLEGSAKGELKGAQVSVNGSARTEVKGGAMVEVQGALVKIN